MISLPQHLKGEKRNFRPTLLDSFISSLTSPAWRKNLPSVCSELETKARGRAEAALRFSWGRWWLSSPEWTPRGCPMGFPEETELEGSAGSSGCPETSRILLRVEGMTQSIRASLGTHRDSSGSSGWGQLGAVQRGLHLPTASVQVVSFHQTTQVN